MFDLRYILGDLATWHRFYGGNLTEGAGNVAEHRDRTILWQGPGRVLRTRWQQQGQMDGRNGRQEVPPAAPAAPAAAAHNTATVRWIRAESLRWDQRREVDLLVGSMESEQETSTTTGRAAVERHQPAATAACLPTGPKVISPRKHNITAKHSSVSSRQ